MATFGKVLAVINVLAAIGFLWLAGMDYSKRQNWAYAYYRGQLGLNGLPVDANDPGRQPGQDVSRSLGKGVIADVVRGQGPTVYTQVEEVTRRQNEVKNEIDQADNLKAKGDVLAKYLLPLATRGDERDDSIRRLLNLKTDKDVEDLTARLNGYFERAVSPKTPQTAEFPDGAARELEDRRRSIADLLYNLDATPEGRTRTQAVVGIAQYVGAGDRQFANLRAMIDRLRTAIAADQVNFVGEYRAVAEGLGKEAAHLQHYETKLTEQQEQVRKATVLRNARQEEARVLQQEIEKKKQEAAAEAATLDALQRRLFDLQQDFVKLQAGNQRLEREIEVKETGK